MAFFTGDRDYTEETRNIDDMLNRFAFDRKNLVSLLQKQNQKIDVWKYLSLDRECLFSMGKRCRLPLNALCECNDANSCMTNFHICPMCKNMKRIIDFSKVHPKEPFLIECGENVGSFLIYTETPVRLHSSLEESSSEHKAMLNNDSFTNCLLIHYFLQEEVGDIPTIPEVHVGFVCGDKGYMLAENTPLTFKNIQVYPEFLEAAEPNGKLSPTSKVDARLPISGEVGESILMQMLAVLKFLSKYNFSYGTPSYTSIKFKKEPVSYLASGVHISGPLALKICNFENSSLDVGNDSNLRLLNKSSLGELEARRTSKIKEEKTYKIKNPDRDPKDAVITSYRKSLGEPNNSFDLYKFMIVLMSDRTFYISIVSNPKTLSLWKEMWLPSEYEAITERLKDYHETNREITAKDTLRILSDLTLSKDMLDTLWNKVQK